MDVEFKFDTTAEKQLFKNLRELPQVVQGKTLISAARSALNRLIKAARSRVKVQSGTLSKSIQQNIKVYRKGEVLYGVVGIRSWYSQEYKGQKRIAHKYATLVEMKKPFMRPAWEAEKGNLQKYFEDAIVRKTNNFLKKNAR